MNEARRGATAAYLGAAGHQTVSSSAQPCSGPSRVTRRGPWERLDWFREEVNRAGGGNYQTLMNDALRQYVEERHEDLEETLRRVLREELARRRGPRG